MKPTKLALAIARSTVLGHGHTLADVRDLVEIHTSAANKHRGRGDEHIAKIEEDLSSAYRYLATEMETQ